LVVLGRRSGVGMAFDGQFPIRLGLHQRYDLVEGRLGFFRDSVGIAIEVDAVDTAAPKLLEFVANLVPCANGLPIRAGADCRALFLPVPLPTGVLLMPFVPPESIEVLAI